MTDTAGYRNPETKESKVVADLKSRLPFLTFGGISWALTFITIFLEYFYVSENHWHEHMRWNVRGASVIGGHDGVNFQAGSVIISMFSVGTVFLLSPWFLSCCGNKGSTHHHAFWWTGVALEFGAGTALFNFVLGLNSFDTWMYTVGPAIVSAFLYANLGYINDQLKTVGGANGKDMLMYSFVATSSVVMGLLTLIAPFFPLLIQAVAAGKYAPLTHNQQAIYWSWFAVQAARFGGYFGSFMAGFKWAIDFADYNPRGKEEIKKLEQQWAQAQQSIVNTAKTAGIHEQILSGSGVFVAVGGVVIGWLFPFYHTLNNGVYTLWQWNLNDKVVFSKRMPTLQFTLGPVWTIYLLSHIYMLIFRKQSSNNVIATRKYWPVVLRDALLKFLTTMVFVSICGVTEIPAILGASMVAMSSRLLSANLTRATLFVEGLIAVAFGIAPVLFTGLNFLHAAYSREHLLFVFTMAVLLGLEAWFQLTAVFSKVGEALRINPYTRMAIGSMLLFFELVAVTAWSLVAGNYELELINVTP